MKKLLPLSLMCVTFLTACNALSKGSIFNKKMMNYNFGDEIKVKSYEQKVAEKVAIAVPDGDSIVTSQTMLVNHFMGITLASGKAGLYNAYTGQPILPFDTYNDANFRWDSDPSGAPNIRFFGLVKEADGVKSIDIYDEFGTKVVEGAPGDEFEVSRRIVDRFMRSGKKDQRVAEAILTMGDVRKKVSYNLDGSSKVEDYKLPEYVFEQALDPSDSMEYYGHSDLYLMDLGDGRRYGTYSTSKHKYVATFDLPDSSKGGFQELVIGDYIYTQQWTPVSIESEDYNVYNNFDNQKYHLVQTRYNYTNGKVENIKPEFYFYSGDEYFGDKGFIDYALADIYYITKDKQLDTRVYTVMLDKNLKVKADLTDINFGTDDIVKVGDKYFDTTARISYNEKFEEITRFSSFFGASESQEVLVYRDTITSKYGLADLTGRNVLPAKYDAIEIGLDGRYFASDDEKFYLIKVEDKKGKYEASELFSIKFSEYDDMDQLPGADGGDIIITKDSNISRLDIKTGQVTPIDMTGLTEVKDMGQITDFKARVTNAIQIYQESGAYVFMMHSMTHTYEFGK